MAKSRVRIFLLSPSVINQELCEYIISATQGTNWYKVLEVGINGKLNETIEVSALWSNGGPGGGGGGGTWYQPCPNVCVQK